jgi:alpha-glucosidase
MICQRLISVFASVDSWVTLFMRHFVALGVFLLFVALVDRGLAQTRVKKTSRSASKSLPSYTPLPTLNAKGRPVASPPIQVIPIPDVLRQEYKINPFYQKCVVIHGIPVIGSEEVTDYAFLECAWTLDHMLHDRPLSLNALVSAKVRVGVIGVQQYTMDIPENQNPKMMAKAAYNDRRSRGLGGLPLATCAEENLLNLRGDPYTRENITIHEFAHTLASAIRRVDRSWYERLQDAYNQAKEKGIYGSSYASTNEQEYWAEGAQCWFDCADPRPAGGASNRQELKAKDAPLAALLTEAYGDNPWRYVKTDKRTAKEDTAHLAGIDRASYPVFNFQNSPRIKAAEQASLQPANP